LSTIKKLHATGHLLASGVFLFVFLAGVFSVPLLFALDTYTVGVTIIPFFVIGLLAIVLVYYTANVEARTSDSWMKALIKFLILFPVFLALSMGLSLHNSIAVLQGYLGRKSAFVRTPKFNITGLDSGGFKKRRYFNGKITWTTMFEGVLAIYFLFGIYLGIQLENSIFLIYHILLTVGFGTIFFYSISHLTLSKQNG
jgi:hypothetical protein